MLSRKPLAGPLVAAAFVAASAAAADNVGPSTTTEPYLVPTHAGVKIKSILTVGDSVNGYRMVGIPDGLGAFPGGNGKFTLLMNHELADTAGVARSHGSVGAFVSRWTIRASDLEVLTGQDATPDANHVHTFDKAAGAYRAGTTAWNRFCSGDLPAVSAFRYRDLGTSDRIYLNGEETAPRFSADHGRAFAHIATGAHAGEAWELPRLGRIAFENVLASPYGQKKTIVMGTDDSSRATRITDPARVCAARGELACVAPPSELYMYVGTKQAAGNPIERAGLTNGELFGMRVEVNGKRLTGEDKDYVFGSAADGRITKARFGMHAFGDVSRKTGNRLQEESIKAGVMQFIRIEDGVWDPRASRRNDFYFVTTGSLSATSYLPSRLWRVSFDDIGRPEAGGTIEMLLDSADPAGKPGFEMLDNLTMDRRGRIVMQEDVGRNARLGKVWMYDVGSKQLFRIAEHAPRYFAPDSPDRLTIDEESSGVIDAAQILGDGWFLLDVQAPTSAGDAELVARGQLLALYIDPSLGGSRYERGHDGDDERRK